MARVSTGKGSKQDYGTPGAFMVQIRKHFKGELDLAANEENKKCKYFLGTGGFNVDSLSICWNHYDFEHWGWLWLNPPYNDIAPWYEKCQRESKMGAKIVSLVPMDSAASWFDYVPGHAGIWHLQGRIKFDGAKDSCSKDCALHIWAPAYANTFKVWNWKEDRFLI
jgi:hypothetical protein